MINRLGQSIQEYLQNDPCEWRKGLAKSRGEIAPRFSQESLREMNEAAIFKSADAPPTTAAESGPLHRSKPDGTVSQAFLNRLMDVFMESVGPVAPLIVRHHIGLLGESKDAFPKSRIDELIKSIAAGNFAS